MDIFWKTSGTIGSFTSTTNWVQGVIPGPNDIAELTQTNITAFVSSSVTVMGANLGSSATLAVESGTFTATEGTATGANRGSIEVSGPGAQLNVGGKVNNSGSIDVLSGILLGQSSVTLTGGGTVFLSDNGKLQIAASQTFTNVDNTIATIIGGGSVSGTGLLINDAKGVVGATMTSQSFTLNVPTANSGMLEATGAHAFLLISAPVNNIGGTIEAGDGAVVNCLAATISGGTLTTVGSGIIILDGATLDGTAGHVVTNGGAITELTPIDLKGTINNAGSIAVDALSIVGDTTLEGGGTVNLEFGSFGIQAASNGLTLTNVDNRVTGIGNDIGNGSTVWTLINGSRGVIDAPDEPLDLRVATTNSGLIEATGTFAELKIFATIRNTSSGLIETTSGGQVFLSTGAIIGGKLKADAELAFVDTGDFTLDGSKAVVPTNTMITVSGPVLDNSNTLRLQGTINNTNTVTVGALGTLVAQAAGAQNTVTLEGHGAVTLSGGTIEGGGAPLTLANVNNTIDGAGFIGGDGLMLNNQTSATIDANAADPLTIDTGALAVKNGGVLAAEAESTLFVATNLSNTGKLKANGGSIVLEGTVSGGSAVISGTGSIEFGAASTAATTFAAGATGQLILDDQYAGTISGFGTNATESIDLSSFDFTAGITKSFSAGVLTLKNMAGQTVHLHFAGSFTSTSFTLADDGNFNGTDDGTLITDPRVGSRTASLFNQYIASSFPPLYGSVANLLIEAAHPQSPISLPHA